MLEPQEKDARMWAMFCHLSALSTFIGIPFGNIIGPLIIWMIKKNEIPLVDINGKESLNFQITITLIAFAMGIFALVTCGYGLILAFPVWIVLGIGDLVVTIIAAIKTNDGLEYHYPFGYKFIK